MTSQATQPVVSSPSALPLVQLPESVRGPGIHLEQWLGAWALEEGRARALHAAIASTDLSAHVRHQAAVLEDQPRDRRGPGYLMAGRIAVLELSGPMMKTVPSLAEGTSTALARRAVRAALADPGVDGMLLLIDSPGGTVSGMGDLYRDLEAFAASKPLHAYVEDLSCSAAYWAACAAERIVANDPEAIVGSIGVYCVVHDLSAAAEMAGIRVHVVRAGEHKGDFVAGTEITDEQLSELQRITDQHFAAFVDVVAESRFAGDRRDARGVATGRVWTATEAERIGLIDAIETIDQALEAVRGAAGASDPSAARPREGSAMTTGQTQAAAGAATSPQETPESSKASEAIPSPATLQELQEALPKASAEFLVGCMTRSKTLEEAKADYIGQLEGRVELAETRPAPGADRIGSAPTATIGGASAAEQIDELVAEKVARGMARHDAHRAVMRENPELRESFVESHNAAHADALRGRSGRSGR